MTRVRLLIERARAENEKFGGGFGLLLQAVEELATLHTNFVADMTRELRRLERKIDGKGF